jgi:glucokinase
MGEYVVSVDLGGTQIRAALVDSAGVIHSRESTLTRPEEGQEAVLNRIYGCASNVMGAVPTEDVRGIGIGAPGPLNPWTGVILEAPNLIDWYDVPLADLVEERFELPTRLGNDANLAALAEWRFGAGQGATNMIYMTVSTGIGGGIIADGELLLGSDGLAGEIGHQTIEARGPQCNCGNVGCLEALASGPAIARRTVERLRSGSSSTVPTLVGGNLDRLTAAHVSQAASQGDALAQEMLRVAGFYVGVGIVNLIHIFNSELFVIGGGVSKSGDILFEAIRQVVRERAMASMQERVRIVPASLGDDVVLLGAACLLLP